MPVNAIPFKPYVISDLNFIHVLSSLRGIFKEIILTEMIEKPTSFCFKNFQIFHDTVKPYRVETFEPLKIKAYTWPVEMQVLYCRKVEVNLKTNAIVFI